MSGWKENKYIKISLCAFGVIAASLVLVVFVLHLDDVLNWLGFLMGVLSPFIWGFCFAYVLNYPYKLLQKGLSRKTKKGKHLPQKAVKVISMILTYVIFFAVASLFFYLVIPQVANAISEFIKLLPGYIETASDSAQRLAYKYLRRYELSYQDVFDTVTELGKQLAAEFNLNDMLGKTVAVILNASTGLKNALLGLVVSIYFLWDKERFAYSFKRVAYALMPEKYADKTIDVMRFTDKTFGGFLIAKIVDSTIIGILNYIFMAIMNMEYAILISVIVGVTNIIPFFGPFIGAIPSALLLLLVHPWHALLFVIFIIILQQFDGNFLGPKLMGDTMGIRAVFVVFAVIVFGGLFGIVGMFIGVPMFVVLYTLFSEFISARLKKREIKVK
ncbi:MAG: AI-2E family transporter [Clostridia bacterium]|nr:AI-2E family transporter [Clostridia bacterium]